jgi:hypothetical protein
MIAVGEPFTLVDSIKYMNFSGCVLESTEQGDFILPIYLNNMSNQEKLALRKSTIKVKVIKDANYLVLHLIDIKGLGQFELIFNPLLYTGEKRDNFLKSNLITIIGIESTKNIVQTIRQVNMPKQMYINFLGQFQEGKEIENYSNRYNRWIDDLISRYSVEQLWDRGNYIGKLGE